MDSTRNAVVSLALLVGLLGGVSPAVAQIDTGYVFTGARPFNEPIDPQRYLIRPGEKFDVVFVGAKLASIQLNVNAEGLIVHPELGVIEVAGKTLAEARALLLDPLKRLYRAEQIVISTSGVYAVAVQVSGKVARPGTYVGYTSQRVSEIIDSAGGLVPGGSTRRIVFEGGPDEIGVDLDRYRYSFDKMANPFLYAGYVVNVPPRGRQVVQVTGAVAEPRSVELIGGETIEDLVALAGGALPDANLAATTIMHPPGWLGDAASPIGAGDVLIVPGSGPGEFEEQIKLFGQVERPGLYEYAAGLTLADLMQQSGGPRDDANRDRITVFRRAEKDASGRRPTGRYPFVVGEVHSVALRPDDSVFVPRYVGYVTVDGLVRNPGILPFTKGGKVEDYIRLAGGPADPRSATIVELTDRITKLTRVAAMGTVVYDGDRITVRAEESE